MSIVIAVLLTVIALWAFFSTMSFLQGEDFVTAALTGLVVLFLLACAGGVIYGLYLVWEWAV